MLRVHFNKKMSYIQIFLPISFITVFYVFSWTIAPVWIVLSVLIVVTGISTINRTRLTLDSEKLVLKAMLGNKELEYKLSLLDKIWIEGNWLYISENNENKKVGHKLECDQTDWRELKKVLTLEES